MTSERFNHFMLQFLFSLNFFTIYMYLIKMLIHLSLFIIFFLIHIPILFVLSLHSLTFFCAQVCLTLWYNNNNNDNNDQISTSLCYKSIWRNLCWNKKMRENKRKYRYCSYYYHVNIRYYIIIWCYTNLFHFEVFILIKVHTIKYVK